MKPSESLLIVGEIACRYPGWRLTAEGARVWAADLVEFEFDHARQVVREVCRLHDGDWPPPLSRFRRQIQASMERKRPVELLPEPPMDREQFREGVRQVLHVLEGGNGPLAGELKRAVGDL